MKILALALTEWKKLILLACNLEHISMSSGESSYPAYESINHTSWQVNENGISRVMLYSYCFCLCFNYLIINYCASLFCQVEPERLTFNYELSLK